LDAVEFFLPRRGKKRNGSQNAVRHRNIVDSEDSDGFACTTAAPGRHTPHQKHQCHKKAVGSQNSAELEVVLSTTVAAVWGSAFQLLEFTWLDTEAGRFSCPHFNCSLTSVDNHVRRTITSGAHSRSAVHRPYMSFQFFDRTGYEVVSENPPGSIRSGNGRNCDGW